MKLLSICVLFVLALMTGCTVRSGEPGGIGSNADALKLAPCACLPAQQPGWGA